MSGASDGFPGANATSLSVAAYAIVGAPLDATTSQYPGTRFGPDRIRAEGRGFEDYDHLTERRFTDLDVLDRGNVRPWADVPAYLEFLAGEVRDVRAAGAVPVLLGGEHTVTVAGTRAVEPDHVVCIDAHLDLRASFDGTAWSHATTNYHVSEHVDEVTILGARAGAAESWDRLADHPAITAIPPEDVSQWVADCRSRLRGNDLYLSVDIDGIDPAYAPATGTREPFGVAPRAVRALIRQLAPLTIGFDIVEVNDRDDGQTATLAAKLVREFVHRHADTS